MAECNWKHSERIREAITERYFHRLKATANAKRPKRTCCNVYTKTVLAIGIFVAACLFASLIVERLELKYPKDPTCNWQCVMQSAYWAKFTEAQMESFGLASPEKLLAELSAAFTGRHAGHFARAHQDKGVVHRFQDAHDKLADELHSVAAQWKVALDMKDGLSKATILRDIVSRATTLEHMVDRVKQGRSFDEVKLSQTTEAEEQQDHTCADTLRKIGVGPCREDLGTTTGFLRAVGASGFSKRPQPLPTTWPLNVHYPGMQTLNAEHGIHVVDGLLSPAECAALVASGTIVKRQNRSRASQMSVDISMQSVTTTEEKRHQHRNPKWLYSGMPGALIELDIKSKGLKDCRPLKHDQTAAAWMESIGPIFKDTGEDMTKCSKNGFGSTRYYDVACPLSAHAIKRFEAKVAGLAQGPVSQVAPSQMLHYGPGDFDLDHYDTDAENTNDKVAMLWTVMLYLTGAKVQGGGTYFPKLDLRVNPVVGRALIFPTLSMNLTLATGSLHAEEEVKRGNKWILGTSLFLGHRHEIPTECGSH